jgi:hypothetical protein
LPLPFNDAKNVVDVAPSLEEYMLVPEMMGEHGFADCRWALGLRRGRIKVQSVRREFFDSAQLKTITAGRGNTL